MVEMGLKHTSNDKAQALYLYPMLSPSVINNAFSSVLILIGKKEGKRKTEGQGGREREREKGKKGERRKKQKEGRKGRREIEGKKKKKEGRKRGRKRGRKGGREGGRDFSYIVFKGT